VLPGWAKQTTAFMTSQSPGIGNNYRPVSLTSIIGKTFEAIIRDALVRHLEDNHLITDSQHGFRKGRSCLTNLLEFLDKVTGCIDTGENVDIVFLDFAVSSCSVIMTEFKKCAEPHPKGRKTGHEP